MKGRAYSNDLRSRRVAEVAAGTSRREAARMYRISASSAVRWTERKEQRILQALGLQMTEGSIRRSFKRHGISFKKSLHAAEQDRPDVAQAREQWRVRQTGLDPKKLVFVDETGPIPRWSVAMDAVAEASG